MASTTTSDVERIRIGPAGWSYADWEGIVYPPRAGRGFDRLRWIARHFDFVEINVSFYRTPAPRVAASWAERVAKTPLRFSAKLPRSLTHGDGASDAELRRFDDFLAPLVDAGRLDALLAQFPWSFRPGPGRLDSLARLRERFAAHELVVELRHEEWMRPPLLAAIVERGYSLASIDQPLVSRSCAPLEPVGDRVRYVRLHGRNAADWFAAGAGRDRRYDYSYGDAELREWAERIERLAAAATTVRVVTNNHFRGQAVANAFELAAILGKELAEPPSPLLDRYPDLARRVGARSPRQGELFGEE